MEVQKIEPGDNRYPPILVERLSMPCPEHSMPWATPIFSATDCSV